jgi:hypothetical protein
MAGLDSMCLGGFGWSDRMTINPSIGVANGLSPD